MNLVELAVEKPKTIAVGVILALLAGLMAILRVPIQMTPEVDSVVIAATTYWENASALEIESDVIEEQEKVLGDLSGLLSMTSISRAGAGQLRLEFVTGTDIDGAMAEVSQKLNEVPGYPVGVDEPEIVGLDPESIDYIAWIGLSSSDPSFDPTTLHDLLDRRLRPRFERIPGVAEVGMVGSREMEVQVHLDPDALARRGITYAQFVGALDLSNDNYSGGRLPEGKNDIRIRSVGRFRSAEQVENLVVRRTDAGPVYVRDLATVTEAFKERQDWARARGHLMPFLNFQLESGGNLLETMAAIQAAVADLNAPGGLLEQEARARGIDGTLELVQTYDATTYVNDALELVRSNIAVGGVLAILTLLLFLRSVRTVGIVAIAIPISVIASIAVLVGLGRSVNIISLAGLAFAVGMVVDNAIVVVENIFRHLEMNKSVRQASLDGTKEVAGAVLASTLTTLVVFFPILLIQDTSGQLFRDIALAIMASVGLSMIVSMTVIPAAASNLLKAPRARTPEGGAGTGIGVAARVGRFPAAISATVRWVTASTLRSATTVGVFVVATVVGIVILMPPLDYLPQGNRNVVFGILFTPPAYNLDQISEIGTSLEAHSRPAWEVTGDRFGIEETVRGGPSQRPDAREPFVVDPATGLEVVAPELDHYFLVARDGLLFQAAITADKDRVVDTVASFNRSVSGAAAPDVFSVAVQLPLFRTGGTTGSALKIDLTGDDLPAVERGAAALMFRLIGQFGMGSVTPDPANFLIPTPELRFVPDDERLSELGMSRRDVGLAVQANSDGMILPRQFELGGELKDIKILSPGALGDDPVEALRRTRIASPDGNVLDLGSVASIERVSVPERIKHVNRQRGVTLQFTPPVGTPLQEAIESVEGLVDELRSAQAIPTGVEVGLAGSAGKLNEIKTALLGDGSLVGTITSSLFLALLVVYLLMVVLFQSWTYPLVIMTSVPLATLGGFAALAAVHAWSVADRYMPVQNLDVLTILGFVILAGVVVNNAILIVHQALNFIQDEGLSVSDGIARAVESRVRPIAMSTLTSVGGMLPLVLMPGSGSELYRGLGAVVVGGLLVSTVFTLVLTPVLLNLVMRVRESSDGEPVPAAASTSNEKKPERELEHEVVS